MIKFLIAFILFSITSCSTYTIASLSTNVVTVASTGDATDFGNLTDERCYGVGACANATRGTFAGGWEAPGMSNIIDYVTISSPGDASDFGDLTASRHSVDGLSGSPT